MLGGNIPNAGAEVVYANHQEAFSYQNLNTLLANRGRSPTLVRYGDYSVTIHDGFLHFERKKKESLPINPRMIMMMMKENPPYGWKFQISIDDENSGQPNSNLARAWDIVEQHFVDNEICHVKIIPEDVVLHKKASERGKQITLYVFEEQRNRSVDEWQHIFQAIENALVEGGIRPSYPAFSTRQVPGSSFLYYRNDKFNGKYIGTLAANGDYNPAGDPDPFEHLVINAVPGAIPPMEWIGPGNVPGI